MIRVRKPSRPPEALRTLGQQKRRKHCTAYTAGTRKFEFDREIYSHAEVKLALVRAQHGKCCFCEAKVLHIQPGDVEHFRPKSAYRQQAGDPLSETGYYWLAYDWTNLLLSCENCNRREKGNLFPLRNPALRATRHTQRRRLQQEQPLFINPAAENPAKLIRFRGEVAIAVAGDIRAETTIHALDLNRDDLREHRRTRLADWQALDDARRALAQVVRECRTSGDDPPEEIIKALRQVTARIRACKLDSAEYAGMARALFRR